MAASEPVDDDSFKARVNRVFGSLSSSPINSLWSLTDDKLEKREWNRNKDNDDDETLCSSSYDQLFKKMRKVEQSYSRKELQNDLSDAENEDNDREEWDIRSSIGLDCTLDKEEEEDEYDKVAEGRENTDGILYMRNIIDERPSLNAHSVLSNLVHRDPRANHLAAQVRLKEDAAAAEAEKCESTLDTIMSNDEECCTKAPEEHLKLKPILKRKGTAKNEVSKTSKQLRFHPDCKTEPSDKSEKPQKNSAFHVLVDNKAPEGDTLLNRGTRKVPDYVLNPSKYTHYSLDTSVEHIEESNSRACSNFLEQSEGGKIEQSGQNTEGSANILPRSITFIPRKKASDAIAANGANDPKEDSLDGSSDSLNPKELPIGIAVGETQPRESEVEEHLEMDATNCGGGTQKPGRKYRIKSKN